MLYRQKLYRRTRVCETVIRHKARPQKSHIICVKYIAFKICFINVFEWAPYYATVTAMVVTTQKGINNKPPKTLLNENNLNEVEKQLPKASHFHFIIY